MISPSKQRTSFRRPTTYAQRKLDISLKFDANSSRGSRPRALAVGSATACFVFKTSGGFLLSRLFSASSGAYFPDSAKEIIINVLISQPSAARNKSAPCNNAVCRPLHTKGDAARCGFASRFRLFTGLMAICQTVLLGRLTAMSALSNVLPLPGNLFADWKPPYSAGKSARIVPLAEITKWRSARTSRAQFS